MEDKSTSPYNPADYFQDYTGRVSGAGAEILFKYSPEISTLGIEFNQYPTKNELPVILVSKDDKVSIALRKDSDGNLHLSALVEVGHGICNNKRCSVTQKWCKNAPLMKCYCSYFGGVSQCYHSPCGSNGGGVELGAVDFTVTVPDGEW
jgi:hypothetical protein